MRAYMRAFVYARLPVRVSEFMRTIRECRCVYVRCASVSERLHVTWCREISCAEKKFSCPSVAQWEGATSLSYSIEHGVSEHGGCMSRKGT